MTALTFRPLVAGEEDLFDSLPDPLPELRQASYADGLASGGFHPSRAWVALRDGAVVARAAWVLPPGAQGEPWLERFDAHDPEIGAALLRAAHEAFGLVPPYYAAAPAHWRRRPEIKDLLAVRLGAATRAGLVERGERLRLTWAGAPLPATSGRYRFRPATGDDEINALVARVGRPDVVTGAETALAVAGLDLATDPLPWLRTATWLVADEAGLVAAAGDHCYPLIGYLGLLDDAAREELIAEAVRVLAAGGAREVVADVDSYRVEVLAALERTGFRQIRSRVTLSRSEG
ncbi:N-acetyltransferase [Paractinoplanes deccanensis]|uniref:N-acetyltransferase n=1 Tax=Paractinoplanes deccanensis TaxID=113561 RepID=A0ABQ3Y3I5_9ACTN|nr:acetyltransferase [Actinoplanes deccanensis]GID74551.1 N-acetyltransferase [Actinoplanes deccanensis]